jgi:hypothetical protein
VEANDRVRVATREYATEFSDTILDEEFSAELCDLVSPAYFTTCLEELPTEPLTSDARSQCISATNWVENCMPASSEQAMGFACDDG